MSEEKAKNWHFYLKVTLFGLGLSLAIYLLPFDYIWGGDYIDDTFESYNEGPLTGQGDWNAQGVHASCNVVSTSTAYAGSKSVYASSTCGNNKTAVLPESGLLSFYFRTEENHSNPASRIYLGNFADNHYSISIETPHLIITGDSTFKITSSLTNNVWHKLLLDYDFNTDYLRAKLNNATWTPNVGFQDGHGDKFTFINYFGFHFDNVTTTASSCTSQNCSNCNFADCQELPECTWNSGTQSCGKNYTKILCGPWWQCQWCVTQATCQNVGCTWQNGVCSWYFQEEDLTPWDSYYADHSDYATPTNFINELASSTGPFYNTLRGWATSFGALFSASSGQGYGSTTGYVIPYLRGWGNAFNNFFNDLPVIQLVFVSLLLLFASILWQVLKGLWTFIKFW